MAQLFIVQNDGTKTPVNPAQLVIYATRRLIAPDTSIETNGKIVKAGQIRELRDIFNKDATPAPKPTPTAPPASTESVKPSAESSLRAAYEAAKNASVSSGSKTEKNIMSVDSEEIDGTYSIVKPTINDEDPQQPDLSYFDKPVEVPATKDSENTELLDDDSEETEVPQIDYKSVGSLIQTPGSDPFAGQSKHLEDLALERGIDETRYYVAILGIMNKIIVLFVVIAIIGLLSGIGMCSSGEVDGGAALIVCSVLACGAFILAPLIAARYMRSKIIETHSRLIFAMRGEFLQIQILNELRRLNAEK